MWARASAPFLQLDLTKCNPAKAPSINSQMMPNVRFHGQFRKQTLIASLCAFFLIAAAARGQQVDAAFGLSTVSAPSAASASANYSAQSLTGGAYPSFSGDFLIKKQFGVNGEISWRASQAFYQGFYPFRPIFYDFNGIWIPQLGKHFAGELMAGIGAESARFYQPFIICGFNGCTNYVSSNHSLGHFGGGIRAYLFGNFFVRPEAHLYLIRNNFEFSSARATRFGVSIGYTFRPQQY